MPALPAAPRDPFEEIVRVLLPEKGLRVWSVLVTLFGDLAQSEGARLNVSLLAALTQPLDIRPEALRVALHRLRKDGWLEAERSGRSSLHGLSARGRAQSLAAGVRIYGVEKPPPRHWKLAVLPLPHLVDETAGGFDLQPGVRLLADEVVPKDALILEGKITALPDWVAALIAPEELGVGFAQLDRRLAALLAALHRGADFDPLETATLRVLIVHEWRRLLLRLPDLPDTLRPADWPGISCRQRVQEALCLLQRPEISQLQTALG